MPQHGKPFTKLTDAQRAAANAKLTKDAIGFLKSMVQPAVMGAAAHLDANPDSLITQVAQEPFVKATIITVARAAHRLSDEAEEKADEKARAAAEAESAEKPPVDTEIKDVP